MTDLIEVKTADLAGEALGWAVGKAEGLDVLLVPPQYGNPWRVFARYQASVTEHTKRYNPWEDWALGGLSSSESTPTSGGYRRFLAVAGVQRYGSTSTTATLARGTPRVKRG